MKYKILQFSFGDGFAGSAKMAILSSKALVDQGHSVKLVVSKDSLTKKRALEKGIPIIELDSKKKNSLIVKDILANKDISNIEFVVAYHSQDRKVVMKIKSKLKQEIISVAYRQNISLSTPIIGSFLYNKYFDFMIACSNGVAKSLKKDGIKKNKVFVIHNTTEVPENISEIYGSKIRSEFNLNNKIILGISSWFHKERKGFDILFDVFSKLDDRFVLLIIGIPKANQKEVIEYAKTFNISKERLIMPGFIDNVFEYYKAMDMFLLPSRSEGFSLALLEAAACSLPIIASDIPGNDEFIEQNKNGLKFNIDNGEELRQNILQLADNKKFAEDLGKAAEKSFSKEYTLQRYTEKLIKFLDDAYSAMRK